MSTVNPLSFQGIDKQSLSLGISENDSNQSLLETKKKVQQVEGILRIQPSRKRTRVQDPEFEYLSDNEKFSKNFQKLQNFKSLPKTPTKYYQLSPCSHKPVWTPDIKRKLRKECGSGDVFYYIYKNKKDGKSYVGISTNPYKRTSQHANAKGKKREQTPICQAIKNEDMQFGILLHLTKENLTKEIFGDKDFSSLKESEKRYILAVFAEIERQYIQMRNSKEEGYNRSRGGEGVSRRLFQDESQTSEFRSPMKRKMPKKTYPMSPSSKRFRGVPKKRNVIYAITEKSTEKESTEKIYIGQTSQMLCQRAAQHSSLARAKDQRPVYETMRSNRNVNLSILQENVPLEHLDRSEKGAIKWAREHYSEENILNVKL